MSSISLTQGVKKLSILKRGNVILIIVAAILVSLSAVRAPAPGFVPVTGSNAEGLAQYQRSERGAPVANLNGLATYHQSERGGANAAPATSNQAGLAQYYLSERGAPVAAQDGLAIYHQSERMQAVNWTKSSDPLYKYHQSEWFGK
jgi:hypothetical protein